MAWLRLLGAAVPLALAVPVLADDSDGPRAAAAAYEAALAQEAADAAAAKAAEAAEAAAPTKKAGKAARAAKGRAGDAGKTPPSGQSEVSAEAAPATAAPSKSADQVRSAALVPAAPADDAGPVQTVQKTASRPAPGALRDLIARHAREQNIPSSIANGVILVESRFNPRARNGRNLGLTQISFGTARAMGYTGTPDGLLDPDTNLRFGLRYLGQAYRLAGGDTCRTILKYQAGHRAVTMTSAARSYCSRVKTVTVDAD